MKIRQLFLRNVRSIKSLDLDFTDPVTGQPLSRVVLIGANGSGKTTILEHIYGMLAMVEHTEGNYHLPDARMVATDESQAELVFSTTTATASILFGKQESFAQTLPSNRLPLKFRAPELWLANSVDRPLFAEIRHIISEYTSKEVVPEGAGSILYFPSDRLLSDFKQSDVTIAPARRSYQWAFRYKASAKWKGSMEDFLVGLDYLDLVDYRERNVETRRFQQMVEIINSVLEDKRIAFVRDGRVMVKTRDGQAHQLGDLSSGEKQLVLLLIEIARRIVPGSIILIDEPEISLHPAWQRGLMGALDKLIEQYDAQVILATHSEEIATSVMPEEVIGLNNLSIPRGVWNPAQEALA